MTVDHCAECGFTYDEAGITGAAGVGGTSDVATTLRTLAAEHVAVLESAGGEHVLRTRPAPQVWSALEYTCHVRDVLLIQRDRVILALVEDSPSFPRMYREERVVLAAYPEERPEEVAHELVVAANLAGKVFERLSGEQARRLCIYNFPAPTERNVAWLGVHTVHEASHHLLDVRSVLAQLTS
jgi:S-DNA-T family DNA segregation ATPase FtsK/SpoIIIE